MAAKTAGTWVPVDQRMGYPGTLAQVDATALFPLGTIIKARDLGATAYGDAEFMYVQGAAVAGNVAPFVVTIGGDFIVTLIVARAKGAVGLLVSTLDTAAKFGWVQIRGKGVAQCDVVASGAACYIDGTTGRIDDAAVAGDQIIGMQTQSTDDTSTCLVSMPVWPAVADFDNA